MDTNQVVVLCMCHADSFSIIAIWLAYSQCIVCHCGPPFPLVIQSIQELSLPFHTPSGSQLLHGCAGGIPVLSPHQRGQLLEGAGKGRPSWPEWSTAREGGPRWHVMRCEWASQLGWDRGWVHAAPLHMKCDDLFRAHHCSFSNIDLYRSFSSHSKMNVIFSPFIW